MLTIKQLWNERLKNIKAWTGFEHMTLRDRRSALPTELSSQLGAWSFEVVIYS